MKPIRKIIGGSLPRIVYHDSNGKLHRTDGPAVVNLSGAQYWVKHGKTHRNKGAVAEIDEEGFTYSWNNGSFVNGTGV